MRDLLIAYSVCRKGPKVSHALESNATHVFKVLASATMDTREARSASAIAVHPNVSDETTFANDLRAH
jgi:hypothetical protein